MLWLKAFSKLSNLNWSMTKLKTREKMRLCVFEYIESRYNHKRRFSALGNLTIDEFWNQYNIKKNRLKMLLNFLSQLSLQVQRFSKKYQQLFYQK
jgi:hypothetical protein